MSAPDVIYLQWYGDGDPEWDNEEPECTDVTWAAERVYDADIVYRRERDIELPDGVFAALRVWAYDKSWDVEAINAKSITYKGHTFVSSGRIEVT